MDLTAAITTAGVTANLLLTGTAIGVVAVTVYGIRKAIGLLR